MNTQHVPNMKPPTFNIVEAAVIAEQNIDIAIIVANIQIKNLKILFAFIITFPI